MFLATTPDQIARNSIIPFSGHLFYELYHLHNEARHLTEYVPLTAYFGGVAIIALTEVVARAILIPLTLLPFGERQFSFKERALTQLFLCHNAIFVALFSIYSFCTALFVQDLLPHLIRLEFATLLTQARKDQQLADAYANGIVPAIDPLLKKGANPHAILPDGETPAIVALTFGHKKLIPLDFFNAYEKFFIALKRLSHWLGLRGTTHWENRQITLEGTTSCWTFASLAEDLAQFGKSPYFSLCTLGQKNLSTIEESLRFAYERNSPSTIVSRIQSNVPTFIDAGWKRHGICLAFYDGYLAISNRGEGTQNGQHPTLLVRKIDSSRVTPELIQEIALHAELPFTTGVEYFYHTLLRKLDEKRDAQSASFEAIAPHPSKGPHCSLASKKGAIRFIWGMLLENPIQAQAEAKIFSYWAADECFKQDSPIIPDQSPLHPIMRAKAEEKRKKLSAVAQCRIKSSL